MKISYLSDIHTDFWVPFNHNQLKWESRTKEFITKLIGSDEGDRDVLVVAGDVSHFNIQSLWVIETFSQHYNKVFIVIGNHDLYLVSNNQSNKYKGNSWNRVLELQDGISKLPNVHLFLGDDVFEYNGFKFGGNTMWYPLESFDQQVFFNNVSNDSKLIKGFNVKEEYHKSMRNYDSLLTKNIDVMISHIPVINIDSHFRYNGTACYLTPVKDINVKYWIFGHSHEQKIYEKPYCKFYMNALGYPDESLDLSIKSFIIKNSQKDGSEM